MDKLRQMLPENVLLFVSEMPPIIGMRLKPFVQVDLKGKLGLTPRAAAVLPRAARGQVIGGRGAVNVVGEADGEVAQRKDGITPLAVQKPETDDWIDPPEEFN